MKISKWFGNGILAILLIAIYACGGKSEDAPAYIKVAPSSKDMTTVGGTFEIAIQCNVTWRCVADVSWVMVAPEWGEGDAYVTVTVRENSLLQADKAILTFSGGGETATVVVNRAGASPLMTISPVEEQNLPSNGGNVNVTVNSNAEWTVKSDKDWATLSKKSGEGNGNVVIVIAKNETTVADQAIITFTSGTNVQKLIVNRAALEAFMTITPESEQVIAAEGATFNVAVISNVGWQVTSDKAWLSTNINSGEGNGTVSITVAAATTVAEESGSLTFTSGSIVRVLTIIRHGAVPLINIDIFNKELTSDAGEFSIAITTNGAPWQTKDIPDWVVLSQTKGNGSAVVKITYTANRFQIERKSNIVFTTGDKQCILSLIQNPSKLPDFKDDNEW